MKLRLQKTLDLFKDVKQQMSNHLRCLIPARKVKSISHECHYLKKMVDLGHKWAVQLH